MRRKNNRNVLLGGAAAAAVLAALVTGAVVFSRSDAEAPAAAAEGHEAEEGEAGHAEEGVVALDADAIRAVGIELYTVQPGGLGAEISAPATVASTSQGQAQVGARADGAVTHINVRLGDAVGAGQTLAVLESREAASISADRSSAQARLNLARAAYNREQRLFAARVTARQDLEAAQAALAEAEAEARRATAAAQTAKVTGNGRSIAVTSPIAGRVTAAPAVLGSFVAAGTELFRVTNPGSIQIEASVPATEASRISAGDPAELESAGGRYPATVRAIAPAADPESRALTVILAPSSGAGVLQPGQGVLARIRPRVAALASRTIVVPEEAVQSHEGRDVVFVRTTTGFRAQTVTTGQRGNGRLEVVSGLEPGKVIAARNAFVLKAELGKGEGEDH